MTLLSWLRIYILYRNLNSSFVYLKPILPHKFYSIHQKAYTNVKNNFKFAKDFIKFVGILEGLFFHIF